MHLLLAVVTSCVGGKMPLDLEGLGPPAPDPSACSFADLQPSADGLRRAALLVGVGAYPALPERYQLIAPPADVAAVAETLADYDFPSANVCRLVDDNATQGAFIAAMQALAQATSEDDVVFVYFSGHGSQADDDDGDEIDLRDETLIFHDATPERGGLRDDRFNQLLAQIHADTEHIVVALDACNSGSAARGLGEGKRARFYPSPQAARITDVTSTDTDSWYPGELPGILLLSAASDGTSAWEENGRGYFTQALLHALAAPGTPTWERIYHQVQTKTLALSNQIQHVTFEGDALDRVVFAIERRERPLSWRVSAVEGDQVTVRGVPLPGWSEGAVLRLYPDDANPEALFDPEQDLAAVEVTGTDGLSLVAEVVQGDRLGEVEVGDLAVLTTPGTSHRQIRVALRVGERPGEIDAALAASIVAELARDTPGRRQLGQLVAFVTDEWDFELVRSLSRDSPQLRDREGRVRNTYQTPDGQPLSSEALPGRVLDTLHQHARHRALMGLEGVSGLSLQNDRSLEVRVVSHPEGSPSCARGDWPDQAPNTEQRIPLCHLWNVEVTNQSSRPLLVGGAVLGANGATFSLPYEGGSRPHLELGPGQSVVIDRDLGPDGAFQAQAPLEVLEHIVIVGTPPDSPVDWRRLYSPALTPKNLAGSALQAVIEDYLGGFRATARPIDLDAWTTTHLSYRTVLPDEPEGVPDPQIVAKEYTVSDFPLKDYLPQDENSALYQVLEQAAWLHEHTPTDGVPYTQHAWNQATEEENLAVGIDCSRTQWFVFTRAGLPYAPEGDYGSYGDQPASGYHPTVDMKDPDGPMTDHFDSCMGGPYQTGDVLVQYGWKPTTTDSGFAPAPDGGVSRYGEFVGEDQGAWTFVDYDPEETYTAREDGKLVDSEGVQLKRPVGHTVMVIDTETYVAFGSHGWDGSGTKDTGVEFQRIKAQTWGKWDRRSIPLQACWRHEAFVAEASNPGARAGQPDMASLCDPTQECGRLP